MITLTDEQKQQIVDAAAADIRAKAIVDATDSLTQWVRRAIASTIENEVRTLVVNEIIPAVKEELILNKAVLIAAAVNAAEEMTMILRTALVENLKKKLETNYQRTAIMKAMFE